MVRKSRRNVGEREYVPRNAAAAASFVASAAAILLRAPGFVVGGLLAVAIYLYFTARKEWDPLYALLRVRTTTKPLKAPAP